MKDKYGNKLTIKEFFKRWGDGINGITPIQKLKTQLIGTRITLIGLFLGLAVSIYGWNKLWWVGIILTGAILTTGVQYLGFKQQYIQLKNLENAEEVSLYELFGDINEKEVNQNGKI